MFMPSQVCRLFLSFQSEQLLKYYGLQPEIVNATIKVAEEMEGNC